MKTENFLSEFFFSNYAGGYKFDTNKERELTTYSIEYISDCTKFEDTSSIMFNIFEKCSINGFISIQTIPDDERNGSIINSKTFYYHPVLQMKPKAPVFDYEKNIGIVHNNFLEIRKQFTKKNLLDYIYSKLRTNREFKDYERDFGTIEYLKKRYYSVNDVSWIDMILFAADVASNYKVHSPIDIKEYESDALSTIRNIMAYAKVKNINKEIYRDRGVYIKYGDKILP